MNFKKHYLIILSVAIIIFLIAPTTKNLVAFESIKKIEITSPNGGNLLQTGKTYTITWNSTGVERVYLAAISDTVPPKGYMLAFNAPNTGEYSWNVGRAIWPSILPLGNYKIKVIDFALVSGGESDAYDESDYFFTICDESIHPGSCTPSVKVTSPNGGEIFEMGKTYNITWESLGAERVYIDVMTDTIPIQAYNLIVGVPGPAGEYSWTVGSKWGDILSSGNYKLRVFSYPVKGWIPGRDYDISNNPFTITNN